MVKKLLFFVIVLLVVGQSFAMEHANQEELDGELFEAIEQGNEEAVKRVINQGANANALRPGSTISVKLLHCAVCKDNTNIIKILIDKSAKVDSKDCVLDQPLHYASALGKIEAMKILIGKGAKVDCLNMMGDTPLHYASSGEAVNLLLSYKEVNINVQDYNGMTPLHKPVKSSDGIRALLCAGADHEIKDRYGKIPRDYAPVGAVTDDEDFLAKAEMLKNRRSVRKVVLPHAINKLGHENFLTGVMNRQITGHTRPFKSCPSNTAQHPNQPCTQFLLK